MPNVQLSGSNRTRTVDIPDPRSLDEPKLDTGNGYHQRVTFAVLRDMETLFDTAGITEKQYWEMVKSEFNIVSRSQLLESEYARLSATLKACQKDPQLFNALVAKVKAHTTPVPVTDASHIVFAEPADTLTETCFVLRKPRSKGTDKVVFVGEYTREINARCQTHADKTRCIVQLFYRGQPPEIFYPTLECSPV